MSDAGLARRTRIKAKINGIDVSDHVNKSLISLTYTDNETEPDDLQITLADRDRYWSNWLNPEDDLKISATIVRENWNGDGKDDMLDAGLFTTDEINPRGPASVVTIKSTALPYGSTVRQQRKTRAWEKYTLAGIANEIAGKNGLTVMYDSAFNPKLSRVEQVEETDFNFLGRLCRDAGLSLKATSVKLVIFDAAEYEKKPAIITIERAIVEKAKGKYSKYDLIWSKADTQYNGCRVKYLDPSTGKTNEYTYRIKNGGQVYEVSRRVRSIGEAEALAKAMLRQKNKSEITGSFTLPGDPRLVAGVTILLKGWGAFDKRKYIIERAQHTVSSGSGYDVSINLRTALEGY